MIETKLFELRDRMTFIPILATRVAPYEHGSLQGTVDDLAAERYLLRRAGYGDPCVIVTRLSADGMPANCDPYGWGDRTYTVAHEFIAEHWSELKSGAVVDVEFILGETATPKVSERVEHPL